MARKSVAQRTKELREIVLAYDHNPSAKRANDWDYRFCIAMLERLARKKALTKNMRTKIDEIVEVGLKTTPVNPAADEMDRLADFLLNENTKSALHDFAHKTRMGWKLSEKQSAFAERLMEEAREFETNGYWEPCDDTKAKMKIVLDLSECYSSMHWSSHGRGRSSIETLRRYVAGGMPHISQKDWESARYAVRGKLRQVEQPRFELGSKCFVTKTHLDSDGKTVVQKHFGIICSKPLIHNRDIAYDVLLDGECQTLTVGRITKR